MFFINEQLLESNRTENYHRYTVCEILTDGIHCVAQTIVFM